jgi:DNA-binding NarL/FixJ family response regulator
LKILVATPFPDFRQKIVGLLRANFDVAVVGEAKDGVEAVRLLHADAWDIALLSVRLPVGGGLHFLHRFKAERPNLPVVMVCGDDFPIVIGSALRAGACGYVMRGALEEELVASVRSALAGEVYLSAAMAQWLKTENGPGPEGRRPPH